MNNIAKFGFIEENSAEKIVSWNKLLKHLFDLLIFFYISYIFLSPNPSVSSLLSLKFMIFSLIIIGKHTYTHKNTTLCV